MYVHRLWHFKLQLCRVCSRVAPLFNRIFIFHYSVGDISADRVVFTFAIDVRPELTATLFLADK